MKLEAFRIKNFRSIINTGWVYLSPDNITSLIGQNESGKTSVLEALNSFHTGKVHEDILRGDLSLPEVSCAFLAPDDFFVKLIDLKLIPEIVLNKFKSNNTLYITRQWLNSTQSKLIYGDPEIIDLYDSQKQRNIEEDNNLNRKIEELKTEISQLNGIINDVAEDKKRQLFELDKKSTEISKFKRTIRKDGKKGNKELIEELKESEEKFVQLSQHYNNTLNNIKQLNVQLNQLVLQYSYAEKYLEAKQDYLNINNEYSLIRKKIEDTKLDNSLNPDGKNKSRLRKKLFSLENEVLISKNKLKNLDIRLKFAKECLILALSGTNSNEVEARARENLKKSEELYTLEDLGSLVFKHIPAFKLFEDFSSLLPNRIDLDDMLMQNENVEGFNAVKNFLLVSGLDARFFNEQNSRILKQKIEKLNHEITLHFQDYWSQKVGKSNKIKINFELEHYDTSIPEKKGKPYLEFWVKDNGERLYPKQRSRGVRWFLSFFLELKAAAMDENECEKILLIDEPGLSLHARAQEDVLKVFEDIKENIQIIYSTHSPHLVNTEKIHRLLAVQRAKENDDRSETLIFNPQSLSEASGDTLTPIYSLIGTKLSESNFIKEKKNIIVEDNSTFYYLKNIFEIFRPDLEVFFLPATCPANIQMLSNLLTGWRLQFIILMSDNDETGKIYNELKTGLFMGSKSLTESKILITKDFPGIESLFSTIDFKKHILHKRIGITESNLDYIQNNKLSRKELAISFALHCQNNSLKPDDFDEETKTNFTKLIDRAVHLLKA